MPFSMSSSLQALLGDASVAPQAAEWLELSFSDGAVARFATRPLTVDGAEYRPDLAAVEEWAWRHDPASVEERLPAFRARMKLRNLAEEMTERLQRMLSAHRAEPLGARFGRVYRTGDLGAATADDLLLLADGFATLVRLDHARAELTVEDRLSLAASEQAMRPFRPADAVVFPFSLSAEGVLPFVFGEVRGLELLPWRFAAVGRLAADVTPLDTTITLENTADFAPSGRIQIGEELIDYAANLTVPAQLGSAKESLVRAAPIWHRSGAAVYQVPAAGFAWFVADHRCESVGEVRVRAGGAAVTGAATIEMSVDGRTATLVEATALPVRPSGETDRHDLALEPASGFPWSVGPFNLALDPLAVATIDDPETFAELDAEHPRLHVRSAAKPGLGGLFGPATRARLMIRYSASVVWQEASELRVHVSSGGQATFATIARPTAAGPVPDRTIGFDLTSYFGANWRHFDSDGDMILTFLPQLPEGAKIHIAGIWWAVTLERAISGRIETAIVADVRGWMADTAGAIENPASLAEKLVLHEEALGLGAGALDTSELAALVDGFAQRQELVARAVRSPIAWGRLLGELLDETGLALVARGGDWRLAMAAVSPLEASGGAPLGGAELERSAFRRELALDVPHAPERRRWSVFHGEAGDRSGNFRALTAAGEAVRGGEERVERAHWLGAHHRGLARLLATRRLAYAASRSERIDLAGLAGALVKAAPGDTVALEAEALQSGTALARVVGLRGGRGAARVAIVADLYADGVLLGEWGTARMVQRLGRELCVFIEGRVVAHATSSGDWLLRGDVREFATLPSAMSGEAIEYNDAQRLLLLVAPSFGGSKLGICAIDADGNLLLRGGLRSEFGALAPGVGFVQQIGTSVRLGFLDGTTLLNGGVFIPFVLVPGTVRERGIAG